MPQPYAPYPNMSLPYPYAPGLGQQQPASNVTWVVGRAGADAYVTQPGTTTLLMDSTEDVFYLKETDAAGRATITTCDFKRRDESDAGYATKADLAALRDEILEAVNGKQPVQASHLAAE